MATENWSVCSINSKQRSKKGQKHNCKATAEPKTTHGWPNQYKDQSFNGRSEFESRKLTLEKPQAVKAITQHWGFNNGHQTTHIIEEWWIYLLLFECGTNHQRRIRSKTHKHWNSQCNNECKHTTERNRLNSNWVQYQRVEIRIQLHTLRDTRSKMYKNPYYVRHTGIYPMSLHCKNSNNSKQQRAHQGTLKSWKAIPQCTHTPINHLLERKQGTQCENNPTPMQRRKNVSVHSEIRHYRSPTARQTLHWHHQMHRNTQSKAPKHTQCNETQETTT